MQKSEEKFYFSSLRMSISDVFGHYQITTSIILNKFVRE